MNHSLQVFDPAMCCSTGVCGPSVDQRLIKLASDLAYLKSQGVVVERFNLAHQPEAFTNHPTVIAEMGAEAENLPIFIVGDAIKSKGVYPSRVELALWVGIDAGISEEKPRKELKLVSSDRCC